MALDTGLEVELLPPLPTGAETVVEIGENGENRQFGNPRLRVTRVLCPRGDDGIAVTLVGVVELYPRPDTDQDPYAVR